MYRSVLLFLQSWQHDSTPNLYRDINFTKCVTDRILSKNYFQWENLWFQSLKYMVISLFENKVLSIGTEGYYKVET